MKDNLSDLSMLELFRVESETQTSSLTSGLLELERAASSAVQVPSSETAAKHGTRNPELLESLMRAAHSLKGAARIVNLPIAVRVAHAMEDYFVAAQGGQVTLGQPQIDLMLRGVDLLVQISRRDESNLAEWEAEHGGDVENFVQAVHGLTERRPAATGREHGGGPKVESREPVPPSTLDSRPSTASPTSEFQPHTSMAVPAAKSDSAQRVVRLNAENLNRLLGLAGESLVESRWLRPFSDSMQRLKRLQLELEQTLNGLRHGEKLKAEMGKAEISAFNFQLSALAAQAAETRKFLAERLEELDLYDRRSAHLSNRLYLEVLRTRMRPFAEGTRRFPRMVRDLARSLGKQVRLEILGENTQVDRDILERLETPLAHLLRNAVDHGCESPEERAAAGKRPEAVIQLEARHSAGLLLVVVSDDGAGIEAERLRASIVERRLTTPPLAEKMTEAELLEFLFLPGFTLKDAVTEISGRGVGLDVVQNMVKSVRGNVRVSQGKSKVSSLKSNVQSPTSGVSTKDFRHQTLDSSLCGLRFELRLPLTLSVLRTLLVEVAGEAYAIPLAQIAHTLKLSRQNIETLEGRHHFAYGEQRIGLLTAHQVLDCGRPKPSENGFSVVVLGERAARYGLVVDRFLGERELVVQPLDPRLGKVKDISAAALMEDGSPVLIVDVDDMVRSIEKLVSSGALANLQRSSIEAPVKKKKRILAVDDSLTVRELERKLLTSRGYLADVAVDGMDGWNAVRSGVYDLVITDVDMPRMDGIELATLIKKDAQLKSVPVMIVSYKDREEDRLRGLEAGADYYLTKGSFHDETLLQAVQDLIGEPEG